MESRARRSWGIFLVVTPECGQSLLYLGPVQVSRGDANGSRKAPGRVSTVALPDLFRRACATLRQRASADSVSARTAAASSRRGTRYRN